MNKRKEKNINHKLYLARDSVVEYRSFENEMSFYDAVKNGDLETVEIEMNKFRTHFKVKVLFLTILSEIFCIILLFQQPW